MLRTGARGLPGLLALGCLIGGMGPCAAQDADGDGIPDAVEEQLGTDPGFAEQLETLGTFVAGAQSPELDVVRVDFGNVAHNRWLWAVHFAHPYTFDNSLLIIYLDSDNDPSTGRTGMGCEVMLVHRKGVPSVSGFAPDGGPANSPAPRVALHDGVLYMCHDGAIRQHEGRSVFRVSVLSEMAEPHRGVDSTGWIQASAPPNSERPPILTLDDITENEGFEATEGLDLIWQLQADPANIALSSVTAELENMAYYDAEYRWPAVRGRGGRISVIVPQAGRFHPALVVYDSRGRETYELQMDGRRLGRFVASEDDNRQRVFFLSEPVEFQGGERLTFLTGSHGAHITEDILLLAERPPVRGRRFELSQFQAGVIQRDGQLQARLTWITTWPAKCTVEYWQPGGEARSVTEPEPVANHRVFLTDLPPGAQIHVRVRAPKPDGTTLLSHEEVFTVAPPEPVLGTAVRESLALKVANPHSFALTAYPVTNGVPFQRGELGSPDHVRLLDAAGAEVPLQASVTARWPDGSIKWLLITFAASAKANSVATYTLEYGTEVARQSVADPLAIHQEGDVLRIVTGPLQAEFDRSRSGLPTALWYDANADGAFSDVERITGSGGLRGEITREGQGPFTTLGPPESLEIEEAGPLRAVVKTTGHHRDHSGESFFTYTCRFIFHSGQPTVRVLHTWGNDEESDFATFDSLHLQVALAQVGEPEWMVGLGSEVTVSGQGDLSLRQMRDDSYEIDPPVTSSVQTERADGFVVVSAGDASFLAAIRDFWQLYPKSLQIDGAGITLGLCPDFPAGTYDNCTKLDEIKLYFALMGGKYKIRQGMTKQHEVLLACVPRNALRVAAQLAAAFQDPPIATCTPERYCDTLVFGEILPATTDRFPEYERVCEQVYQNYVQHQSSGREYGMLNYGDQWGERRVNWANGEYDHTHAFLLQYVRSGDRRWYALGEKAARHAIDVDTCHYGPNRGGYWIHAMGHTGGYFDEPYEGSGIPWGGFTPSHTWTEGFYDWYFLSGDPTAAENAALVADYYDGAYLNNYDWSNCRDNGWHLILTLAAYRATNDPYYLNAARIIVERTLERQTPLGTADAPSAPFTGGTPTRFGGWHRQMVPGHCYDMPRHRGEANFMLGVLANGLELYYNEVPDPRVAEAVIGGAGQVVRELWVPEVDGFRYTSCPNMTGYTANNDMTVEMLFFARRLGADPQFGDIAMRAMRAAFAGGIGSIAHLRWTPHLIYNMDLLLRGVPQVTIEGTHSLAPGETTARLHARASDTDNDITHFLWQFPDGTTAEGPSVEWRPPEGGRHKVTVTVTDRAGHQTSASTTISAPPPELAHLPPERMILVEAENFADQGLDQVRVFERIGSHGKLISYWDATVGHWLEWHVEVPEEGDYTLYLRYASGAARPPRRALLVDGQSPGPAFDDMTLPVTGGYSTHTDNWEFYATGGGRSLHLTAGPHRLRLINLGDGVALDYLLLVRD